MYGCLPSQPYTVSLICSYFIRDSSFNYLTEYFQDSTWQQISSQTFAVVIKFYQYKITFANTEHNYILKGG